MQGNRIRDPRHGSNPWRSAAHGHKHPYGPIGVMFDRCGRNHVIRYNEIGSTNGNHYNDGISGSDNFSAAGFPWADSDIYGNRISDVYDDGIEAEGANRNVRIWANHRARVRGDRQRRHRDRPALCLAQRRRAHGAHVRAGRRPRATSAAPSSRRGSKQPDLEWRARLLLPQHRARRERGHRARRRAAYNFVARNNAGPRRASSRGRAVRSRQEGRVERIPNFNDRYPRPEAGARRSGAPPMRFGAEAYRAGRSAD